MSVFGSVLIVVIPIALIAGCVMFVKWITKEEDGEEDDWRN